MGQTPSSSPDRAASRAPVLAALVVAALAGGLVAQVAAAQGVNVPLPPPPPGTTLKKPAAPQQAPAQQAPATKGPAQQAPAQAPAPTPAAPKPAAPPPSVKVPQISAPPPPPGAERCVTCHGPMLRKRVVHQAVQADNCHLCHKPAGKTGKCRSKTSTAWILTKEQPDLCYSCHKRKDTAKEVHTAVRVGECLECHAAHASDLPALAKKPKGQMCLSCHELESVVGTTLVKHAPASEALCLDCHDPHGTDLPKAIRAAGKSLCLRCHEASAPTGHGTPGPGYRVDFKKATVHKPVRESECSDCHVAGHGGDNLRMLKKSPPDLCYGCHKRQDDQPFVHGAVRVGDCAVCHAPHSSDQPKLLARANQKDLCFICHSDDVTGRTVVHKPVAEGKCQECHGAHGAPGRMILTKGEGKKACYACHKPVDGGKLKHGALERYGCTGCHDPHGTANRYFLAKKTNDLCITCHAEQKDGVHVTSLITRGGHVIGGSGMMDPRRPGHEFSCASCHNPHGSDSPKLFYFGNSPMESCDGCHGNKSGLNPTMRPITNLAFPKKDQQQASAGEGQVPPQAGSGGAGGSGGGGDAPGTQDRR